MAIVIYHNPNCGTSRNTLAMIRQSGEEPEIIEYLKTPPTAERLRHLLDDMGISVRDLLRKNVPPYEALGLADPKWTDEQIIDLMVEHPDPHQPADCSHAQGGEAVPAFRSCARHPAQSEYRPIHQRGWRGHHQ